MNKSYIHIIYIVDNQDVRRGGLKLMTRAGLTRHDSVSSASFGGRKPLR